MIQASKNEFEKSPISLNSTNELVKRIKDRFEGKNFENSLNLYPTKHFFVDINDFRKRIYKTSGPSKLKKLEKYGKCVNLNVCKKQDKSFGINELIPPILCNKKTRYYGFGCPKVGELARSKLNE